jgi:23S rRNA pseudouridine1911/1915/1917 synthase
MHIFHYSVDPHDVNKRLDIFLAEQTLPLTRSHIKKLITTQSVTVNKHFEKAAFRLKHGDEIEVCVPEPSEPRAEPENIPLHILYEDESIILVNKPSGMVVHPAAGNYSGTLVNALLYHCSFIQGVGGVHRPGIVHRLDKGTSGVLVVAKNDLAHQNLSQQFKNHSVRKIYTALVHGQMADDEGSIDVKIGRHSYDRKKMSTHTKKGRFAITHWKVIRRFTGFSLLEVSIHTGRTHQIRVHLSSAHHPIIGDPVYGSKKSLSHIKNDFLLKQCTALERPFLHATLLGFEHPATHRYQEFVAPLPQPLTQLLTLLESETCLS